MPREEPPILAVATSLWPPRPPASKPTRGPVADAAHERVCAPHHDKPCRAPDHPPPYWQYLERLNTRYGGLEAPKAERGEDRFDASVALRGATEAGSRAEEPTGVGVLPKDEQTRNAHGPPCAGDTGSGSRGDAASGAYAHDRLGARYVPITPGTRVDVVV